MNNATTQRYSDMKHVSETISNRLKQLNQKCKFKNWCLDIWSRRHLVSKTFGFRDIWSGIFFLIFRDYLVAKEINQTNFYLL